jgi:hypothetical protein
LILKEERAGEGTFAFKRNQIRAGWRKLYDKELVKAKVIPVTGCEGP